MGKRCRNSIDYTWLNQGLVPLDIDRCLAGQSFNHLRDAICPARMFWPGHFDIAKLLSHFPNLRVVGGHHHFSQGFRLFALLYDMLDQGLASDQSQRFAWEARGCIPGWNHSNNSHGGEDES